MKRWLAILPLATLGVLVIAAFTLLSAPKPAPGKPWVWRGEFFGAFDSSYRCTDQPRKFGFLTKFNLADRQVKWVSPTSVSDVNFVVVDNALISANGGSCVDDFAYKIDKETGSVLARFKTPKAIERMDYANGQLIFQLYEGAAAYQLE